MTTNTHLISRRTMIAQAGVADKLVAIGFDGNGVLQNFVKDGTIAAICVQSSYNMGYLGVKTAYDASVGKKTVKAYVDTGFLLVTKENIDTTPAKNVLY